MSIRQERLNHQIRDEISQILTRGEVKDPRLGLVSVNEVRLSRDLRYAKVFISAYGDPEETEQSLQIVQNAQGYIRRLLGQRLRVRHVPELTFLKDTSLEEGLRMDALLSSLPEFQREEEEPLSGDSTEEHE